MNIFSSNYISRRPIDRAMRTFGKKFSSEQRILDIGCGNMPYKRFFLCEYVGVDADESVKPNIIANAWDIPQPDDTFDGIVLNQSLEHIGETNKTVKEISRLLKPNGLVIITVPHAMRTHSSPLPASQAPVHNFNTKDHKTWHVDYYRFTKFGLLYVFRDFELVSMRETSGYAGTIFQLLNYFFASIGPAWLFFPIYCVSNLLGLSLDRLAAAASTLPSIQASKFYAEVYLSLPVNYVCVFRKKTKTMHK